MAWLPAINGDRRGLSTKRIVAESSECECKIEPAQLKPSALRSGGSSSRACFSILTPTALLTVAMYSGTVRRRTQTPDIVGLWGARGKPGPQRIGQANTPLIVRRAEQRRVDLEALLAEFQEETSAT